MANLLLYVHPKNITMECGVTKLVSTMKYYNKTTVMGNILQNKNTGISIGILYFQNIFKILFQNTFLKILLCHQELFTARCYA